MMPPENLRWATALTDAEQGLNRAGYHPKTTARVLKHARKFGREVGNPDPWNVTPAEVSRWLDAAGNSEHPDATRARSYRSSLRTVYRWAYRVGRIETDPTAGTDRRAVKLQPPPAWAEPLAAYRRWLLASGATWQTLESRCYQIARLAREIPAAGPWTVCGEDLVTWHARHRWGREMARSNRNAARSFYGWAVKAGRISEDPSQLLPPVRLPDQSRLPASDTAYAQAVAQARPREALLLRLAAELGLRRTELATVHRRDLSEASDGYWLSVKGKGGKLRHLPIPETLTSVLLARWDSQGGGYLFPGGRDGHLDPRTVGKLCSGLLPPGVTVHALRHRFATVAYQAGSDLFATQQLLGHSNPATTQRYVHTSAAALRAAVNAAQIGG